MSFAYDKYLTEHKANVAKGYKWFEEHLPWLLRDDYSSQICINHDLSKTSTEEYDAYDKYFYGGNRSYAVVNNFNKAWLHHIHNNPHHWQHWVLINDDPKEGTICIEMPWNYIIEMICDWWAFSWSKDNLYEIFNWYDDHKDYIKFNWETKKNVESILNKMKEKLLELNGGTTE